ncbi:Uma2 family endonuclease [Roseofilum reptotaenium CS-1145]|nr:hypothetical protein [Roseofilum sp. Guam]MBP0026928.1 Uma2 family endonuclease [Roseofilum sp. Guam]MDB9517432.1 Uma2 family endonuclease [Roseofilum reptotaenium CS-1145]
MSITQILKVTQQKMQEYLDNGTRLAWLIIPSSRKVAVYCLNQEIEV